MNSLAPVATLAAALLALVGVFWTNGRENRALRNAERLTKMIEDPSIDDVRLAKVKIMRDDLLDRAVRSHERSKTALFRVGLVVLITGVLGLILLVVGRWSGVTDRFIVDESLFRLIDFGLGGISTVGAVLALIGLILLPIREDGDHNA